MVFDIMSRHNIAYRYAAWQAKAPTTAARRRWDINHHNLRKISSKKIVRAPSKWQARERVMRIRYTGWNAVLIGRCLSQYLSSPHGVRLYWLVSLISRQYQKMKDISIIDTGYTIIDMKEMIVINKIERHGHGFITTSRDGAPLLLSYSLSGHRSPRHISSARFDLFS